MKRDEDGVGLFFRAFVATLIGADYFSTYNFIHQGSNLFYPACEVKPTKEFDIPRSQVSVVDGSILSA